LSRCWNSQTRLGWWKILRHRHPVEIGSFHTENLLQVGLGQETYVICIVASDGKQWNGSGAWNDQDKLTSSVAISLAQ
jgi:hypothetical protein